MMKVVPIKKIKNEIHMDVANIFMKTPQNKKKLR